MNFQPGFRISLLDFFVLVLAMVMVGSIFPIDRTLGVAIAFVVLHFFLFCNVFRISRSPELIWAATFVGLALLSLQFNFFAIEMAGIICVALTVVLVGLEMRKPGYHGIFWQKINPNLMQWFAQEQ